MTEFDYEATLKQIKSMQQSNIAKIKALQVAGHTIDPGSVANIKIDTFVETFLDKNAQAGYVLAMERNLQAALSEALLSVNQQKLIVPGN